MPIVLIAIPALGTSLGGLGVSHKIKVPKLVGPLDSQIGNAARKVGFFLLSSRLSALKLELCVAVL